MAEQEQQLNILLVDERSFVRDSYRHLLETSGTARICAEAMSAEEAFPLYRLCRPSVVVMGIALPGISGIEATRLLLRQDPDARILICTTHSEDIYISRALKAGAIGYLTKSYASSHLVEAVQIVSAGDVYLSPDIAPAPR